MGRRRSRGRVWSMAVLAEGLIALSLLVAFTLTVASPPDPPEAYPDLDIDSDNNNVWPSTWPDRSAAEDEAEDVLGDPARPGKLIAVNDGDDDGDGIPDFADGWNWDWYGEDMNWWYESWGFPWLATDDDLAEQREFVPVVLEIPPEVDLGTAIIAINYCGPPAYYDLGVTVYGSPYVFSVGWGTLRLWRTSYPYWPLSRHSCKEYGDYVPPDCYTPAELGLSEFCRTITLYVEAALPSSQLADEAIEVTLYPEGWTGPGYSDVVRLTCVRIDLDIDSDNTNGLDYPMRTDWEDQIEDSIQPKLPGKFIQVNDADDDGDGIPDFADGFDLDGIAGNDDDETPGKGFVPLVLEIPNPLWDLPNVAEIGTVTFTYAASDPAAVSHDPESGAYTPAPGKLRLWLKNGAQPRNKASAAAENPGDFIPAGTPVKLSALGLSAQSKLIYLYAEGIGHTTGPVPDRIVVGFDPDGPQGPLPIICRDAVRVRLIRLEFVIPDSYDDETGLPAPDAQPVPTSFVGVSDPRPTVTLDELPAAAVTIANGFATLTLNGIVRDPIAATAALPPPEEPEAPSGIYASLYIPESPTAGGCDVVGYFHGLRDATAEDPAFAEAEGEPASLVFRGAFLGLETTIALDPATFPGLTENVDSFTATITHAYPDGAGMTLFAVFTETTPESRVFQAVLPDTGGGTPGEPTASRQWLRKAESRRGGANGTYRPMCSRVVGLQAGLANEELDEYEILIQGIPFKLESYQGAHYLRGGSLWVFNVDKTTGKARLFDRIHGTIVNASVPHNRIGALLAKRQASLGCGAVVHFLEFEMVGYVYGEESRMIADCEDRSSNSDPQDDVRVIAGGHVRFRVIISPPELAYAFRYLWGATQGTLDQDVSQQEVNWDAPPMRTVSSVWAEMWTTQRWWPGGPTPKAVHRVTARVTSVAPRVVRVKLEGLPAAGRIVLKDAAQNATIEPPQYDRTNTTWERGFEADSDHSYLKNDDGLAFKNESAAYVKHCRMKLMADLAATDYDGAAGPNRDPARQLHLSAPTPMRFRVSTEAASLTFKNAASGQAESPEFEVQEWALVDYNTIADNVAFTSEEAVGGDPPKIRFYWDFPLDWTFKVKNKAGQWVNALGGNAAWQTVHRSLCVADTAPIIPPYTKARDITAPNTAWEETMQYSCDWARGKGAAGHSATPEEEQEIVDALWAGISEADTSARGARQDIKYTLLGSPGRAREETTWTVRAFLAAGYKGSCAHQARFFSSLAAAQGIEVNTILWQMKQDDPAIDAVFVAVGVKDVDGDWCEYPGSPPGTMYWWYNIGAPGNHAFCMFGTKVYDPSFGGPASTKTWQRYLWEAITHVGFVAGEGAISWHPKSLVEAGTYRVTFDYKLNDASGGTGTWPPVPSP